MQFGTSDNSPVTDDTFPEDDIDQLFQKLQPVVTPGDIVQQVLARVKQLPAAQRYQPKREENSRPSLDSVADASEMHS